MPLLRSIATMPSEEHHSGLRLVRPPWVIEAANVNPQVLSPVTLCGVETNRDAHVGGNRVFVRLNSAHGLSEAGVLQSNVVGLGLELRRVANKA